jgi:hypothetical protein
MHAILGLAATHLSVTSSANYTSKAINHRLIAIQGFNSALSRPLKRGSADGDALLAACYALTFQSSYMQDGLALSEFLTMVRGCSIVSNRLATDGILSFFGITSEDHFKHMETKLENLPVIEDGLRMGAAKSLEALDEMCKKAGGVDQYFYNALQGVINGLSISSKLGNKPYCLHRCKKSMLTNDIH